MKILKYLSKILPVISAEAHCDVPCAIYEPTSAKLAAQTALRMVLQIKELKQPADMSKETMDAYLNSISRRIMIKENHSQICKNELLILWSDFFKLENLAKYPSLHEVFWKAIKLCSKNKQEINEETAKQLVSVVDEIAKIFYEVKNTPEKYESYKKITDKLW